MAHFWYTVRTVVQYSVVCLCQMVKESGVSMQIPCKRMTGGKFDYRYTIIHHSSNSHRT